MARHEKSASCYFMLRQSRTAKIVMLNNGSPEIECLKCTGVSAFVVIEDKTFFSTKMQSSGQQWRCHLQNNFRTDQAAVSSHWPGGCIFALTRRPYLRTDQAAVSSHWPGDCIFVRESNTYCDNFVEDLRLYLIFNEQNYDVNATP